MATTRSELAAPPAFVPRHARSAALAVGILVALAVVALLLFFTVGGPFGALNDVFNTAVGVASATLAGLTIPGARHPLDVASAVIGVLGGIVFSYGAWLVLSDTTGFFLAGLVSGVGAGLLGVWLLVVNRSARHPRPDATSRLGRLAGAVMTLGLLGVPGWLSGVDDGAAAPWFVGVAMLGWVGTYVLYPAWCLRGSAGFRATGRRGGSAARA